ncbi:hypothetical protein HG531_014016 [Fusarium graminearum]|nr:hypothetical protein HG531_014016 [Fusarium graminearum]
MAPLYGLNLELLNTFHRHVIILFVITLASKTSLPKLSARQSSRLLDSCLLHFSQTVVLLLLPLILHLLYEAFAPLDESLRGHAGTVELLVLLCLCSLGSFLVGPCDDILALLDELLGIVL